MISVETVEAMTHAERMLVLGKTVVARINANDMIVKGSKRGDHASVAEGKRLHDDAARDAHVLRY